MSAPEFMIRSLGVVAILGCSSVLIFWVELMLTVTFGCLALKIAWSSLAQASPSPPLKMTTFDGAAVLRRRAGCRRSSPRRCRCSRLGVLPAQALSRPAAGVTSRPAAAARRSRVRRSRSGVTDIVVLSLWCRVRRFAGDARRTATRGRGCARPHRGRWRRGRRGYLSGLVEPSYDLAVSSCASSAEVTEETAQTAPPPSSGSSASPYGAPLSSTTSARSASRRPDGCRGATRAVCSTEVTAINVVTALG